jgi:hypothetical protein
MPNVVVEGRVIKKNDWHDKVKPRWISCT